MKWWIGPKETQGRWLVGAPACTTNLSDGIKRAFSILLAALGLMEAERGSLL